MNWIQFIAGIGLGTLGAKLLDILWLQGRVEEYQKRTWLRDNRLNAFSEVIKEFISFGLHESSGLRSPFQSYGVISKALLLLDDDALIERIDRFIVDMEHMNRLIDSKEDKEADKIYNLLVAETREIIKLLRNIVLHDRVRTY